VETISLPHPRCRHSRWPVQPQTNWQIRLRRCWSRAAEWESAKSWDGKAEESPPEPPATNQTWITIADATEAFLASRSNRGITPPTLARYKTFIKQLRAHCDSQAISGLINSPHHETDYVDREGFLVGFLERMNSVCPIPPVKTDSPAAAGFERSAWISVAGHP